jgi:hypothetical protein
MIDDWPTIIACSGSLEDRAWPSMTLKADFQDCCRAHARIVLPGAP